MKAKKFDPENRAKLVLGALLRKLRLNTSPRLSTEKFAEHVQGRSVSSRATKVPQEDTIVHRVFNSGMVKNIEAGRVSLPKARIWPYFETLRHHGVEWIRHEELVLAVESAREFDSGRNDGTRDRFSWASWTSGWENKEDILAAASQLEEALRMPAGSNGESESGAHIDFRELSAVQIQMVDEIVQKIKIFGSTTISDPALNEWEKNNVNRITGVRAIVGSLASEMDGTFDEVVTGLVRRTHFRQFHYLIAARNLSEAEDAWKDFRKQISEALLKQDDSSLKGRGNLPSSALAKEKERMSKERGLLMQKLKSSWVTPHDLDVLCNDLNKSVHGGAGSDGEISSKWDCLYYYECDGSPSLLVGVFRRFPARVTGRARSFSSALNLTNWEGALPMNEALARSMFKPFVLRHQKLADASAEKHDDRQSARSSSIR